DSKYLFHFEKQEDGTYIITTPRSNYLSNSGGEFSIWDEVYGNGSKQTHWGIYGEKGNYFLSPVETSGLIIYKELNDYYEKAVLRMFDNPDLDYLTGSLSIRQPGLLQDTGTEHDNGHYYTEWQFNGRMARTHTHTCTLDHYTETLPCEFDEGVVDGKVTTYTCRICGGWYNEVSVDGEGITRVAGETRFGTAMAVANTFRDNQKLDSLDTVILACSSNFADALAGSYLAVVRNAPILLTNTGKAAEINAYVSKVLKKGGRVYVLGGPAAVPESCLKGLEGFEIKRLAGENRYETNLAILNEAGVDTDVILVGTGRNFADSLSASATGLPLVLVNDRLNMDHYYFLNDNRSKTFVILGGTGAVNSEIEEIITSWVSKCERVAGETRYETSKLIAERFFPEATGAVIAYAGDFPDGLCGGPLSFQIGAPLLLTAEGKDTEARHFMRDHGIKDGYVLGGTARLTDELVRKVFYLGEEDPIKTVTE
ncbi:MAG: cell wall-binding repeat-containing protein, partial [Erysipelotrichaceae bacterium]|nr:cell wall-binding repeat-containing protein [Erysipelotrichaceae bacterium]